MSKKALWTGRFVSGVAVLFLLFDGVIHLLKPVVVVQAFNQLGVPISASVPLGVLELVLIALYLVPRTSALGAVLLTGYLGGAIAIHLRAGNPFFNLCFPVIIGALFWGGLYLCSTRLRAAVAAYQNQ